jgi:hypothetical protein
MLLAGAMLVADVSAGALVSVVAFAEGVIVEGAWPAAGGVSLPGERPGEVSIGPFMAPFGAGDGVAVCAQAMPVLRIIAAEASRSDRMGRFL